MAVRGPKAADTRQRILDAARELFAAGSAGFTLGDVAQRAGTSVQTVLRAFGSKERLIVAAVGTFREDAPARGVVPSSTTAAIDQLFDDYEEIGDRVIWLLAEEHRVADFATVADLGRAHHRNWVETAFEQDLLELSVRERRVATTALVAATDVYLWKLLRRDFGLDRKDARAVVLRLVRGVLRPLTRSTTDKGR